VKVKSRLQFQVPLDGGWYERKYLPIGGNQDIVVTDELLVMSLTEPWKVETPIVQRFAVTTTVPLHFTVESTVRTIFITELIS